MMGKRYYFVQGGKPYGPVAVSDFQRYGIDGQTLVFTKGMTNWTRAADVPELSHLFAPKPPAFVPTPPTSPTPPGTPPPYDSTSSNGIEKEEPKSTKPYVIVGVIAAIVLIALLVFFIFFYPKNKASADNWEGTDCDSAATEVADSAVDSVDVYAADTVWTSEVEPSDSYEDDYEPSYGGYGSQLANMALGGTFFGISEGATGDEIRSYGGSVMGEQRKATLDGWKLQIFFDGNAGASYSVVTGIAASRDMSGTGQSVYEACHEFDEQMGRYCSQTSDGSYITSSGCYASSGYVGSKFYVYFYFPNAPQKDPAPCR